MNIHLIIPKSEYTADKLVPETMPDARIDRCTREAQQFDLRPLLGDALYYDLVGNYDPAESSGPDDVYEKLVDGETYVNEKDETIIFSGLRMVIKYYGYARLVASNQVNVSTHGVTIKKTPDSESADAKTIAAEVATSRSGAVAYWEEAKKYLNTKKADFPLWKCTNVQPRGGVNIRAVGGKHR